MATGIIINQTVDPSAGAGIAAGIGSIYLRDNAGVGELWEKTGAADTAWTKLGGVSDHGALSGLADNDHPQYATDTDLSTHEVDTTSIHGIANTANLYAAGGTDVAVADGGTGAGTAAGARTNLGLGTAAVAATGDFEAAGVVAAHAAAGDPHIGYQLESGLVAAITATKIDDLTAGDDNTDLDATTSKHGLLPKLGGGSTNFLRADGTWNAPAGGGGTKRVPILLDTPDASGNGYPALSTNNGFSNVRRVVPAFTKDVLGTWEGTVRIPADYASGGVIVCSFVANATANVFRSIVSTSVVAATVTEDTAYTAETAVDTTFATTAKRRVDVSTTLTTTPVANSTLNVKITHDGAHANDTLAVDCLLWECLFEYVSA